MKTKLLSSAAVMLLSTQYAIAGPADYVSTPGVEAVEKPLFQSERTPRVSAEVSRSSFFVLR